MPHEAFYATAAGVIPIFLILLVFQTREYRYGTTERWRRPVYGVLVGAGAFVVIVGLKVSAARRDSS